MARRSVYPFTAIVGQERMKRALILNAVNPGIGGVLIRGERGTAKSTAARALAALLPEIDVVGGCRFGDDPRRPDEFCDECRERVASGEKLPVARRTIKLVELPVSATEDRVVGTLDIEKAIKQGERHFEPGILASAHRGILYVDEVNLLDDHVVDLLLDSAASAVNVVEREGISFQHPARFILIGTMNPEEGDLRPQLLDRFAFSVEVHGISTPRERMAIVERHVAYDTDPESFRAKWAESDAKLGSEIIEARERLDSVTHAPRDLFTIASLTASMHVDGHRADLVILKGARASAAWEGRDRVTERDIMFAAELALPHRLKRGPFSDPTASMTNLDERIEQLQGDYEATENENTQSQDDSKKKVTR